MRPRSTAWSSSPMPRASPPATSCACASPTATCTTSTPNGWTEPDEPGAHAEPPPMTGAGALGALRMGVPDATGGPVIGLALDSGAARGCAHLGVLQKLAREGIQQQIITVCSIGAFVGAAAASGDLDRLVR